MTDAHIVDKTSTIAGIYTNGVEVVVQLDGMVRILFHDTIGGAAVERAHLVMTTECAQTLVNLVQTLIHPSAPASAAN